MWDLKKYIVVLSLLPYPIFAFLHWTWASAFSIILKFFLLGFLIAKSKGRCQSIPSMMSLTLFIFHWNLLASTFFVLFISVLLKFLLVLLHCLIKCRCYSGLHFLLPTSFFSLSPLSTLKMWIPKCNQFPNLYL